jgi:chromosome segregation ATPase
MPSAGTSYKKEIYKTLTRDLYKIHQKLTEKKVQLQDANSELQNVKDAIESGETDTVSVRVKLEEINNRIDSLSDEIDELRDDKVTIKEEMQSVMSDEYWD